MRTNAKDMEKYLKLQGSPSELQEKDKDVVTDYWGVFMRMDSVGLSRGFNFILTQVTIHPSASNL